MKPSQVPDDEIWDGARRVTVAGDGGDIEDVDGLVDETHAGVLDGAARFNFRVVLEDGDLEKLTAGGVIWLSFYGNVVPWSIEAVGPPGHLTSEEAADLLIKHGRALPAARAAMLARDHSAIDQVHRAAIRNVTKNPTGDAAILADLGRAADLLHAPRRTT